VRKLPGANIKFYLGPGIAGLGTWNLQYCYEFIDLKDLEWHRVYIFHGGATWGVSVMRDAA